MILSLTNEHLMAVWIGLEQRRAKTTEWGTTIRLSDKLTSLKVSLPNDHFKFPSEAKVDVADDEVDYLKAIIAWYGENGCGASVARSLRGIEEAIEKAKTRQQKRRESREAS